MKNALFLSLSLLLGGCSLLVSPEADPGKETSVLFETSFQQFRFIPLRYGASSTISCFHDSKEIFDSKKAYFSYAPDDVTVQEDPFFYYYTVASNNVRAKPGYAAPKCSFISRELSEQSNMFSWKQCCSEDHLMLEVASRPITKDIARLAVLYFVARHTTVLNIDQDEFVFQIRSVKEMAGGFLIEAYYDGKTSSGDFTTKKKGLLYFRLDTETGKLFEVSEQVETERDWWPA